MKNKLYLLILLLGLNVQASFSQRKSKAAAVPQKSLTKPAEKLEIDPSLVAGATGRVTFRYQGKLVTYTTVRAKDGNIWLQQNLGSHKVASTFDDDESLGDLFQWGRWDDGHQLVIDVPDSRNGTASPNNPDGLDKNGTNPFYYDQITSWWLFGDANDKWTAATPAQATATNGCDPCKAIGNGWRLPSKEEMKNVYTLERITDGNGAIRSTLKLPCGGYRKSNFYGVLDRGRSGTYWTSTPAKAGAYGIEWGPSAGTTFRGYALSIRCLKAAINQ